MLDKEKFNQSAVFRIPETADFLWSGWEDAHIVYDKRSGHTQVLNDFAREILALFEDGPKSVDALYVEFSKIFENELDHEIKEKILETAIEFDNMGLIEPVSQD